jgi:undecaprenyl-diphosphatase
VGIVSGVAFISLALWVSRVDSPPASIDEAMHAWIIAHRSPASLVLAQGITWGGAVALVLPLTVVIGTIASRSANGWRRRLRAGLLVGASAGIGIYLGLQINSRMERPRPPMADWVSAAGGPAFPSGHTTAATIFAASCAWVIAARLADGWPRRLVWLGAVAFSASVGWSRVWLGVHWPTDVLGAWLWAVAWFGTATAVILLLRQRSDSRRTTRPGPAPQPESARRS